VENVALSDALFFGVIASRDRQARSASIGIPETQEHRVGAVTADKLPIFISDHRPELDAHEHLGSKGLGLYRSALASRSQSLARPWPRVQNAAVR
jgi:hypothetical protein